MFPFMPTYPAVTLKSGRERSIESRHPWIFSGALAAIPKNFMPGTVVNVFSAQKKFLARGFFNPHSQIAVRILTFEPAEIDPAFFRERILKALEFRRAYFPREYSDPEGALRLVFAESDQLPGLIVDRYGSVLVVQFLSAGMMKESDALIQILKEALSPKTIFEKSGTSGKNEEGLVFKDALVSGEPIKDFLVILENGLRFYVDVLRGQKTGFYLDLRDVRRYAKENSAGKSCLNIGCYTGSISMAQLAGGAKDVSSIDSSLAHLEILEKNLNLAGFDETNHKTIQADMFEFLRYTTERYDFIVLDPPAFAHRQKDVPQAIKGYKELHLSAFKLLNPGGELITLSCSHHISREIFEQTIFYALKDLKITAHLIRRFDQPVD
ncbi:MAG: class I SAM-dependent rRNA methyltransferase, partial [Candidatus Omnitrophica bacterium]|nr:class I SAM-dependent rRNA methyltransferase [Candidatus Omnitrophota bacterium]